MQQPTTVNLPDRLYTLVRARSQASDTHRFEALKAQNPDGELVAFAFTSEDYLKHFVERIGARSLGGDITVLEVSSADFLEQLAGANETKVHIDPMQECEHVLAYNGHGVLQRASDNAGRVMRKACAPLPDLFLDSLRGVAGSLPTVEAIWCIESVQESNGEEPRMLLVVEQSVGPEDFGFDAAFMELGDRWCETLPPGIAVDMVASGLAGVAEHLDETSLVYRRDESAPQPVHTAHHKSCVCGDGAICHE